MRTLLLDGDIFVYQAASACEIETEWEDDLWTLHSDFGEAKRRLEEAVYGLKEDLDADRLIFALSDPKDNFRKGIYPAYKSNRKKVRKPLAYKPLRAYATETFEVFERPTLEGDDVLGILATHPKLVPGEKIIVSIDKDMKTIPGLHYRTNDPDTGVFTVNPEEADRWHLIQSLAGDATDGYPGCPGIGMDRATKAVDEMTRLVAYEHALSRGPRAGQTETRYKEETASTPWEVVSSRYIAAGLSEEEALVQARCARILRASDYDFKNKRPIPWSP